MTVEAVRLPALAAVFFTEAATTDAAGRPIPPPMPPLSVRLTSALPNTIRWKADARGLVLLGPGLRYDTMPDANQRAQPVDTAPDITGTVQTLDGRYNPRAFSASFSPSRIAYVPLYPSPAAARFGEAGGVAVSLRYTDGTRAAWAVATVSCIRNGQNLLFAAQADAQGDLAIPLTGLPPLPPATSSDTLTVSVRADPAQSVLPITDPNTLPPRRVRLLDTDPFTDTLSLTFIRGQLLTARDLSTSTMTIEL